jgi:hypothetical protein
MDLQPYDYFVCIITPHPANLLIYGRLPQNKRAGRMACPHSISVQPARGGLDYLQIGGPQQSRHLYIDLLSLAIADDRNFYADFFFCRMREFSQ